MSTGPICNKSMWIAVIAAHLQRVGVTWPSHPAAHIRGLPCSCATFGGAIASLSDHDCIHFGPGMEKTRTRSRTVREQHVRTLPCISSVPLLVSGHIPDLFHLYGYAFAVSQRRFSTTASLYSSRLRNLQTVNDSTMARMANSPPLYSVHLDKTLAREMCCRCGWRCRCPTAR